MTVTNLQKTLDDWAEELYDKASQNNTSLQESIDAFKAATAYYAARRKNGKKSGDDEPDGDGFSFAGSNEVVHGASGQRSKVRAS